MLNLRFYLFIALFLSTIIGYGQHKDNTTVFEAPKKIVKQTEFYASIPIYNDTLDASLYFYFVDGIVDTVVMQIDTVVMDSWEFDCEVDTVVIKLEGLVVEYASVYILNNKGELLYPKPFEEVRFLSSHYDIEYDLGICDYDVCSGYTSRYDMRRWSSFDPNFEYHYVVNENSSIHNSDEHPLMVKYKGKWGLLKLDGELLIPIEYDHIKWGDKGIELYSGKILDKIIAFPNNN